MGLRLVQLQLVLRLVEMPFMRLARDKGNGAVNMPTTPIARQLDADFQKACQYLEGGRTGSAVDLYKSLYERGDYRGIEGLRRIEGTKPEWEGYVSFVIKCFEEKCFEERRRPISVTMAMYQTGFSFSGLIYSMEKQFGSVRICRGVLDAMRTADWGHPYNAFEELVAAAGTEKGGKKAELLKAVGVEMGMDENAIGFFSAE